MDDLGSLNVDPALANFDLGPTADLQAFCEAFTVETLAGTGAAGFLDGPGDQAQFNLPYPLTADGAGVVYVGDLRNPRIRKVQPDGTTSTLAGNGAATYADGSGGPNGTASFIAPSGITVDASGTVYVSDSHRVRKVAADGTTTTFAGNGIDGFVDGSGGANGTTEFLDDDGIVLTGGFVYVTDTGRIRRMAVDGSTTTFAGNGTLGFFDGTGGPGGTTEFYAPRGLAFDVTTGGFFVADSNRIRHVAPNGDTTTFSGNGQPGNSDGSGGAFGSTELDNPNGVAASQDGFVYVSDTNNHRIVRLAPDGSSRTIGGFLGPGNRDGSGCVALFNLPYGIALSGKRLYVADLENNTIRVIYLP